VGTSEAAIVRERCAVHPDRPSVGRCASCERPSCLDCAVPFRGSILCQTCASREIGFPRPPEPARARPSRRPEIAAGVLLALALLATVAPWHRSGTLTSVLSAWRPGGQPWSLVACIGLVAALSAILGPMVLGRAPSRPLAAAYALMAALAAVATIITLAAAPDYISPTLAPFGTVAAAAGASAVGVTRMRALPRGR
jgi:hypothetical protein